MPNPPPTRVAFIGKDLLLALDAPLKDTRAEFLRDDTGAIIWMRVRRPPASSREIA